MNLFIKLFISLLSVMLMTICFGESTIASANSKVQDGVPTVLQGKYWTVTIRGGKSSQPIHEYFYTTKDGFVAKHTKDGNFTAKWMIYRRMEDNDYILNGSDTKDLSMAYWIFIEPNKNWTKIRIGYAHLPINQSLKHYPSYYCRSTATRVSKVTAILH